MFYIVYRQREVIDGPFEHKQAEHVLEDLVMLFEDSRYEIFAESELSGMGLEPRASYHIHEDIQTL